LIFNAIIDAEPDKYRGMAGYDLAVKMTDEAVEQNSKQILGVLYCLSY